MGLAFLGPMGTAKTFTATAFAGECGMTCLKFKNIYEKWVGASEGNLEKILNIADALGFVVIVIDEIDRSLTSRSEGDSGTSSRIFARLKDFMSDTSHRGRVIFLVLSNRPDKVDPDIFRAGRIDKKIPFFFPETPEERKLILEKMLQKNHIQYEVTNWEKVSQQTEGHSGADLEAIAILASEIADDSGHEKVQPEDLESAVEDYLPSRNEEMIEYMTLLAIFHCSSKRLLPDKLAKISPAELNQRLELLRMKLR
jgi:SpoVK/Ycf46/Vps4 family AAA+-type ATPase